MKVKRKGLESRLKEECRLRHLGRMTCSSATESIAAYNKRYGVKCAPRIFSKASSKQIMKDELAEIELRFHPPDNLVDVVRKKKRTGSKKQSAPRKKKSRKSKTKTAQDNRTPTTASDTVISADNISTPTTPGANTSTTISWSFTPAMPRRRYRVQDFRLEPDQVRRVKAAQRHLRECRANSSLDEMQNMVYARGVPGSGHVSFKEMYELCTPGQYISGNILDYMMFQMYPQGHVQCSHLDLRRRHDLLFDVNDATVNARRNNESCEHYFTWVEQGHCLVLPYNKPVNSHWLTLLAWKDTVNGKYYLQARNSMRSLRHNDRQCLKDAAKFLAGVYRSVNHEPRVWQVIRTRDCTEQKLGSNTCALHAASNAHLVASGLQFTHTFDENFVESLRKRMVHDLSVLHNPIAGLGHTPLHTTSSQSPIPLSATPLHTTPKPPVTPLPDASTDVPIPKLTHNKYGRGTITNHRREASAAAPGFVFPDLIHMIDHYYL